MSRIIRRHRALAHYFPDPRAVALALLLVSLGVLICVGVWASRLGDPPAWSFDCSEATCVDHWASARSRYLAVAVGATAAGVAGWVLLGFSVSSRPVPKRNTLPVAGGQVRVDYLRPRFRALCQLLAALLGASILLWGAWYLSIAASRPAGLALGGLGTGLAAIGAWRWMRAGAVSDRAAYWWAGLGAGVPVAFLLVFSLNPLLLALEMMLLALSPVAAVAGLTGLLGGATYVAHRLLRYEGGAAEDSALTGEAAGRMEEGARWDLTPSIAGDRPRTGPGRHPFTTSVLVGAIVVAGVLSARPVEAPPEDAWMYTVGDPSAPADGRANEEADGGAEGIGDGTEAPMTAPSDAGGDQAQLGALDNPVPQGDAAGLPRCTAADLEVTAHGFDGWTGNSVATLTATNRGERPCALRGTPSLLLEQGGQAIPLAPHALRHLEPAHQPQTGIGLHPGESAMSRLYWPGYRTAADQNTKQSLTLRLSPDGDSVAVVLDPEYGPAPFDLKAGVDGGAAIEIGAWEESPG